MIHAMNDTARLQTNLNALGQVRARAGKFKKDAASSSADAEALQRMASTIVARKNRPFRNALRMVSGEFKVDAETKNGKKEALLLREKALVKKINTLVENEMIRETEEAATLLGRMYPQFKFHASRADTQKKEITMNIALINTEIPLSQEVRVQYGEYSDKQSVLVTIADFDMDGKYEYKCKIGQVAGLLKTEIPNLLVDIFGKKVYEALVRVNTRRNCTIDIYLNGQGSGAHIGGPEPERLEPVKVVFALDKSFNSFSVNGQTYPRLGGALSVALNLVKNANKPLL